MLFLLLYIRPHSGDFLYSLRAHVLWGQINSICLVCSYCAFVKHLVQYV